MSYLLGTVLKSISENGGRKIILSPEYISRYLEYVELQEARENAENATVLATASIERSDKSIKLAQKSLIVSALLAICSILLSFLTLYDSRKSGREIDKKIDRIYYSVREIVTEQKKAENGHE